MKPRIITYPFLLLSLFLSFLTMAFAIPLHENTAPNWGGANLKVALASNDATTYFSHEKPLKGSDKFAVEMDGKKYLFVNQQNMDEFKKDPKKYLPQFDGKCAYALTKHKMMQGNPDVYTIHKNKLYLFKNNATKVAWLKSPEKNLTTGTKFFDQSTFRRVDAVKIEKAFVSAGVFSQGRI